MRSFISSTARAVLHGFTLPRVSSTPQQVLAALAALPPNSRIGPGYCTYRAVATPQGYTLCVTDWALRRPHTDRYEFSREGTYTGDKCSVHRAAKILERAAEALTAGPPARLAARA